MNTDHFKTTNVSTIAAVQIETNVFQIQNPDIWEVVLD